MQSTLRSSLAALLIDIIHFDKSNSSNDTVTPSPPTSATADTTTPTVSEGPLEPGVLDILSHLIQMMWILPSLIGSKARPKPFGEGFDLVVAADVREGCVADGEVGGEQGGGEFAAVGAAADELGLFSCKCSRAKRKGEGRKEGRLDGVVLDCRLRWTGDDINIGPVAFYCHEVPLSGRRR